MRLIYLQALEELVEKLGYIDYRDMLAINRYMIDARFSADYH